MFAYVDETGNTGSNLFDSNQPEFITVALVTKADFDIVHASALRMICAEQGADTLYSSELGFGPIDAMAPRILKLLKKADARFFVSRVEKRYLLAMKIFDTFFDNGENPAVPWTTYNIRPLRIMLAFKVASLLDDDLARRFWEMLMAKSESNAREMIPKICDTFLARVEALPDARSREIISKAFVWSRAHPEALHIFIPGRQAKNGHMPNMVAFKGLLDGLEYFSKRWKRPVRKIVHDRQSQFEGTLAEWHRKAANASPEPIHLPGETEVLRKVPGSNFEFSASDGSAGIQITDLVLWLFRQFLAGKELPSQADKILSFAIRRAWQSDFSFKGVSEKMTEQFRHTLKEDLTAGQLAEACEMQAQVEQNHLRAMALYEQDGLMPY